MVFIYRNSARIIKEVDENVLRIEIHNEKTGKKGDLANGLIAIKEACDLNPWNKEYADLNRKMEDEFKKL